MCPLFRFHFYRISVFLRVSADEGPLFATQIGDSIDIVDIERRLDANFVDMRAAMFLVGDAKWAQFLCQVYQRLVLFFIGAIQ